MIGKKRERNNILIKEDKSSSSSDNYIIPSDEKTFKIYKIKSREALSDFLKALKKPFAILDEKIISDFNKKIQNLKEGQSFEKAVDFSKIPEKSILYLDDEQTINNFYLKEKNKIIFSRFDKDEDSNIKNDEEDIELNLFCKNINFSNKKGKECKISDFCIEYKALFPNNPMEKYYTHIRKDRSYSFKYHLYTDLETKDPKRNRIVMRFFGPRKTCKSIYLRSLLASYHIQYSLFRPTLIFDTEYISKNLVDNVNVFQKVFYHELFGLFDDIYDVDEFFKTIKFDPCETMIFIKSIINLYLEYMEKNKILITSRPLFVIDNYSYIFDNNNILKKIETEATYDTKFNLYIIFSIIIPEDQNNFVSYCYNLNEFNSQKTAYPICYYTNFRNLYEFKKKKKKDGIIIPKEYKNIFGENAYFLFKFINKGTNFEEFVEKEETQIKDELVYFFNDITDDKNDKILIITKLMEYIKNKSEIEINNSFFKKIPSGYIIINRKKSEKSDDFIYSFDYSFPLVKKILENMIEDSFFIDLNNPLFDKLSEAAKGINFDEFINYFFKKKKTFFGYKENEIEKTYDHFCLEKNSLDEFGDQLFMYPDVIDFLEDNNNQIFLNLKNKYKNHDLIKNKKIIVVFQKFQGKFVDILFLIKKNECDEYTIVNLQVKLSNSYKISEPDKNLERYYMTYLKHKYDYIFDIKISDSYVIYLSLFEQKIKFATDNPNIFIFYSRKTEKLVNNENEELSTFPFLEKGKVELISEYEQLLQSTIIFLQIDTKTKLKCQKIMENIKNIKDNFIKIQITKKRIKINIKYLGKDFMIIKPNDNNFSNEIIFYKIMKKNGK